MSQSRAMAGQRQLPPGTRVSDFYKLGLQQPSLEFLDVVLERDTKLYVDPRAFLALRTEWADECVNLIRDFFEEVIQVIHAGDHDRARVLLSGLREPNETRLGLSRGRPSGRGVGAVLADDLYQSLVTSEAVKSGILEHLEDTALLVEGVGVDRISDITTNIVREKLIEFTVRMAEKYGMELWDDVDSGALWSPETGDWENRMTRMLYPAGSPLILVPRAVVRWKLDYDPGEYYRYAVLRFLRQYELSRGTRSPLVQVIKSGKRKGEHRVYLKDVEAHYRKRYGGQKRIVVRATREFPQILSDYKTSKENRFKPPETMQFLTEKVGFPEPKWNKVLKDVTDNTPGKTEATKYHRAVEALLTPLFQPSLVDPIIENEVESGTMRIDIRYRNMAVGGFFKWFVDRFAKAPFVPFECKNYKQDPANVEVGQIASRLDDRKGRLGFLVCRRIDNRKRFETRCRSELDRNGNYILGLDDEDLKVLVKARKDGDEGALLKHLSDRLEALLD
jgi:hypothetical protein